MKSIFSILALIAAFTLAAPAPTMAAAKKKGDASADDSSKKSGDGEKKKDTYPAYGEVVAITDTLLTLKGGKDKPDHKFDITKDTKFKNGKEAATIKDVKVGAEVGAYVKKSADGKGNPTALSINVGVKQKGDAKDGDKKATDKKATDKKGDSGAGKKKKDGN